MIEVENLVKKYGNHTAVNHLTFSVKKGQIYGFLGPNGAGKSTTMNIMTGYLAASEGTVKIDGHDIQKEPEEAKRKIGYLPEIPPLYQEMTVYEYLEFAAELKKIPRMERKKQVDEVVHKTMIEDVSKRLIKNLSKGYKQRVGLAQAMLGNPEVIILDEPTVGLDPKQIIEMRELIKNLGKEHTVILSSHILSEVSAICDHIMIITNGKLVASDSPEGLSKIMSGDTQLELEVKGSREKLTKVLNELNYTHEMQMEETEDGNYVKTILYLDEKEDIREKLFFKLSDEKLPIIEMHRVVKTLEDIFLQLTDQESTENIDKEEIDNKENLESEADVNDSDL